MYKVMVVDDEKFIRKGIINRTRWEEYGFSVAAEADNGQEALQLLEEVSPEAVFVDIRMPVMDGLEFIREALKRFPRVVYIIMSAYSDFSYAQEAIRLGVEDYILKPINKEEMGKVLDKVSHHLNQEYLNRQHRDRKDEDTVFSLCGDKIMVAAFWMPWADDLQQSEAGKMLRSHPYVVGKDLAVYDIEDYSRENCYVYLLGGDLLSEEEVRNMFRDMARGLPEETVIAYTEVERREKLWEIAAKSIWVLKHKMFWPGRRVISAHDLGNIGINGGVKDRKREIARVYSYLLKQEYKKAGQELTGIMDDVVRRESGIEEIEAAIADSLTILRHFPGGSGDTDFNIISYRLKGRDYLLGYASAEEVKEEVKHILKLVSGGLDGSNQQDVIQAIKLYVGENYSSNLNVAAIAKRFYLNAGYLSTLFREKTGMKLVNYIEGIRMEKAKEFLEKGGRTVQEIAIESGYSDANYFTKVFKKYTGMTPRQYRKNTE